MSYVLPGDIIASEEEYLTSDNTYVDNEGNIRAGAIGTVQINEKNRTISVKGKDKKIKIGDIIEGDVFDVKDKQIMILAKRVFGKDGKEKRNYIGMTALFVSNIANSFLEKTEDAAKTGDTIRAEIIKYIPGMIDVGTKAPELGVILAYCSRCRNKLRIGKTNKDVSDMVCDKCKNVEKRKVSTLYIYKK